MNGKRIIVNFAGRRFLVVFLIALCAMLSICTLNSCKKETNSIIEPGEPVDRPMTFDAASTELSQTEIVLTPDSPTSANKNIIWCSSFQLAWNGLKDDVIKEPIKLIDAQEIADRLNNASESKNDVAEDGYYAASGFVKDGIISQIKADMAESFPLEPQPDFPEVEQFNNAVIAYAYMAANVRFSIPYFENDKPALFKDSKDNEASISSFGLQEEHDYAYYQLRNQIKILYIKMDENFQLQAFALDLCKDTTPNQIVLACVPWKNSLKKTYDDIQKRIKEPDDYFMEKFGPNDTLLVPNLFFKIDHIFTELIGKNLANKTFSGPIVMAEQVIQFRLDRSGAELKTEAKLFAKPIPRHFVFDRPFLIYMKKREAERPFFMMWVDNAELLEKWQGGDE